MNGSTRTFNGMPKGWPLPCFLSGEHLHFLHIGKCAGTSVRLLAQSCFSAEECFQHTLGVHGYLPARKFEIEWHNHPVGGFSSAHLGSTIFELRAEPSNVFTWLRDPAEAAFSILFFVTQQVEISGAKRNPAYVALAEIVRSSKGPFDAFLNVARQLGNQTADDFHPLRPLTFMLSRPARKKDIPDSEVVPTAIETLHKCFFIGLLEEQQTSLDMLSRFLPMRSPARSFRTNRTLLRPDTSEGLTESQRSEIRAILAGEYEVDEEGRRLWEFQRKSLLEEGWLELQPEKRAAHAFRRLHPEPQDHGKWTADCTACAEGLNDVEFDDAGATGRRIFWRWTSPGDRAAIRLPIRGGQTVRFALEISNITPHPQLKALALAVGGESLPLRYTGRSEYGFSFEAIIHKDLLSQEGSDIEIFNSTPFQGFGGDTRQLGVAILSISWQPFRPANDRGPASGGTGGD